jgi:SET domain-containing protein
VPRFPSRKSPGRKGVAFPDVGAFGKCRCVGYCFLDVCTNVASATFCISACCRLGARCSNAPRTLETIQPFDTKRVGLGVYTTTVLDVGDVVGEYCGELTELAAVVDGQPDRSIQQNRGYTLLYNARFTNNNVYVDALNSRSITCFISHAIHPNAAIVAQQTSSNVKILLKMLRRVMAGAQVTVHYGTERWFRCACYACWSEADADTNNEQ